MKLENGRVTLETLADGKIAADASRYATTDSRVAPSDYTLDLISEESMPFQLGKYLSREVVAGLAEVAYSGFNASNSITPQTASDLMLDMGIPSEQQARMATLLQTHYPNQLNLTVFVKAAQS